jgi:hypothetical protein
MKSEVLSGMWVNDFCGTPSTVKIKLEFEIAFEALLARMQKTDMAVPG